MSTLTFLGAARTVTGSKYLVDTGSHRVLVDCGLFQGLKELRQRNWQALPVDVKTLDAVVLTHAHIDHVGYLPRLAAGGYRGRVFCTPGTKDLAAIVLPDAGRLQEEDAELANREKFSRHMPALPLFTEADAFRAVSLLQPLGYERPVQPAPGITVEFIYAGHLLGSAFVRMTIDGGPQVLFGGDLGRYDRPVLRDPAPVAEADVLLLESTYGNREHLEDDRGERLAAIVRETIQAGGKVIVPAFAIGRVEEVLYWIKRLEEERRIPVLPVFVDSPMATDALKHYQDRLDELDPEMTPGAGETSAFVTRRLQTVVRPRESKELVASKVPAIVISSSGMATGGRVLHHLKAALPDSRHTILFVGFQAEGTRGRKLVDGAREVTIHGRPVPVEARIELLDSMSAHADASETMRWLDNFRRPPAVTYLVHGEPVPMDAQKARIEQQKGWNVRTPSYREMVAL